MLLAIVEILSSTGRLVRSQSYSCHQPIPLEAIRHVLVTSSQFHVGLSGFGRHGYDPYFSQIQPSGVYPQPSSFSTVNKLGFGNLFNWNSSAPVIPMGPANYPNLHSPEFRSTVESNPGSVYPPAFISKCLSWAAKCFCFQVPNQQLLQVVDTNYPYGWTGTPNGAGYNNWWNTTSSNITYGTSQVMRFFQGCVFDIHG